MAIPLRPRTWKLLLLLFWVAVWLIAASLLSGGLSELVLFPMMFLFVTAPAAAVGTIAGRPGLGFLCGAATALMLLLWSALVGI